MSDRSCKGVEGTPNRIDTTRDPSGMYLVIVLEDLELFQITLIRFYHLIVNWCQQQRYESQVLMTSCLQLVNGLALFYSKMNLNSSDPHHSVIQSIIQKVMYPLLSGMTQLQCHVSSQFAPNQWETVLKSVLSVQKLHCE